MHHFRRWTQLQENSELAANCTAALIIYIKFQTPVHKMRVILALLRWIMEQRAKSSASVSQTITSQILKDIHTIIDHYSIDPTTRTFICCSKCFAIQPLTNEIVASTMFIILCSSPVCCSYINILIYIKNLYHFHPFQTCLCYAL